MVYTEYRPTPLQHYVFPAGGDGLHLVVDENVRLPADLNGISWLWLFKDKKLVSDDGKI